DARLNFYRQCNDPLGCRVVSRLNQRRSRERQSNIERRGKPAFRPRPVGPSVRRIRQPRIGCADGDLVSVLLGGIDPPIPARPVHFSPTRLSLSWLAATTAALPGIRLALPVGRQCLDWRDGEAANPTVAGAGPRRGHSRPPRLGGVSPRYW